MKIRTMTKPILKNLLIIIASVLFFSFIQHSNGLFGEEEKLIGQNESSVVRFIASKKKYEFIETDTMYGRDVYSYLINSNEEHYLILNMLYLDGVLVEVHKIVETSYVDNYLRYLLSSGSQRVSKELYVNKESGYYYKISYNDDGTAFLIIGKRGY